MRVKLTIQYDGSGYSGWQVQENARGVQNEIELALEKVLKEPIRLTGAGRTDKGVHALGQVAHFDAETIIPADKLRYHLNPKLPDDIRIIRSEEVSELFHARYSALSKHYEYTIYIGEHQPPQLRNYSTHLEKLPNLMLMNEAIPYLLGTHDFKAFMSTGSPVKSTERTLDRLEIKYQEPFLSFHYEAESFLYNMVRILTGTLVQIGEGKTDILRLVRALEEGERDLAGPTMGAQGLTLVSIQYPKGG